MRRLIACTIALAAVTAAASAYADEPTVRLRAVDGACAVEPVRTGVRELVGRDPFDDAAVVEVGVATSVIDGGVRAEVVTAEAVRVLEAANCAELSTQIAMAIVLVLEAPPEPPPLLPAQVVDPESVVAVLAPEVQAREPVAADLLLGAAGGPSGDDWHAELVVGVRARRAWQSLGVEMALRPPEELEVAPGRVTVSTVAFTLAPCAHLGALSGCADLVAGWTRGRGADLVDARAATAPLAAVGVRGGWERRLSERTALRVYGEGRTRLTTTRFLVDDMTVWSSPRFEVRLGIGLVARIP